MGLWSEEEGVGKWKDGISEAGWRSSGRLGGGRSSFIVDGVVFGFAEGGEGCFGGSGISKETDLAGFVDDF